MSRKITILGSTGSIGESALRVVRQPGIGLRVYGLSCKQNINILETQIEEFSPSVVAVESDDAISAGAYRDLRKRYPQVEFLEGEQGVCDLASRETDVLVSSIVGAAGLRPTLAAVGSAKRIALANKETLVMAGEIVMQRIRESGGELVPVDSEHSAVFSLLRDMPRKQVRRIILTASGGSVRDIPADELDSVRPEAALEHPTWSMGSIITIDSATMVNKGLEVIEAHHLFGYDYRDIDVIVHPESIIHSMVETVDGSVYAQLGVADMALPIMNAVTFPDRVENSFGRINFEELGSLTFRPCDREKYPAVDLCYSAGRRGGTAPAVLNAANEIAVDAFLQGSILFTDIVKIVEKTLGLHSVLDSPSIEDIFRADAEARDIAANLITGEKQ